jgi:predicted metal-dependent hydrolase
VDERNQPIHSPVDTKPFSTVRSRFARTVPADYYRGPMVKPTESLQVEVRRSRRRTRTVSAYREQDAIVVLVPARLSVAEEQRWVTTMVERVTRAERRRRGSDEDLVRRSAALSRQYLDDLARPASVRWVNNQRSRWGSCTPADRTIRISGRVRGMPPYVVDYVVLHELAHLLVHGHGPEFWAWVNRYPLTERARGFLDGVSASAQFDPGDGPEHDRSGQICPDL